MQGFIISIHRAKDEDTIVTVLTKDTLYTLYRFYGARHSTINLGYKIDFEVDSSHQSTIGRLRHVLHLGYDWLRDLPRLRVWQEFCALFHRHLRESTTIDPFYATLLEDSALIWHQQNPKRIVLEAYVKLLHFEGRLHTETVCFLCEQPLDENFTLVRAFLPVHEKCGYKKVYQKEAIAYLFEHFDSILLHDTDVNRLYEIILQGL